MSTGISSLQALKVELSALVRQQHRDQEKYLQQSFSSLQKNIDSHIASVDDGIELRSELSVDAALEAAFEKTAKAISRNSARKRTASSQNSEFSAALSDSPTHRYDRDTPFIPRTGPVQGNALQLQFRPQPAESTSPSAVYLSEVSVPMPSENSSITATPEAAEQNAIQVDELSDVPSVRIAELPETASEAADEELSEACLSEGDDAEYKSPLEHPYNGEQNDNPNLLHRIVSMFRGAREKKKRASQSVQLRLVNQNVNSLDFLVGILIITNSLVMLLELQWQGDILAGQLGISSVDAWGNPKPIFNVLEHFFTIAFLAEMILRICSERQNYCRSPYNLFDALLVAISCLDLYILTPMAENAARSAQGGDFIILRFLRLVRLTRAIRIVRTVRLFRGLRVLVKACTSFLPSLCWSMTLLGMFMVMCGLIIGNLLQDYIRDESQDYDARHWAWRHYGTAYRSIYTMFELTLAGSWPNYVRPVLENVSHGYVVFFVLYIVIVVFAVIRVITAIFLKDTLDAANSDNDMMVSERLKKQQIYVNKLKDLFCAADQSGDGFISRDELDEILNIQEVRAYLQTLDLEVHEGEVLFDLLDDGDGLISWDEFIQGLLRFKGQARSVDLMMLKAECMKVRDDMKSLMKALITAGVIGNISRGPRRSVIVDNINPQESHQGRRTSVRSVTE